jgi:hypothetical protein
MTLWQHMIHDLGWPWLIWLGIVIFLIIFAYADVIIGFSLKWAVRFLGERVPSTSVKLHTQDDPIIGTAYGVSWDSDGRHFFFYRDYMGWHNLSEGHKRVDCKDPAYCPWHGTL